ncbi:cofH [Symbiodinium natans]|uniref:CofH protein n=1 Tax=Symbiodinium natans TaxID=878477 RepID=A0A812U327_9DINO|nr:cofH [Symbiodinium natans]
MGVASFSRVAAECINAFNLESRLAACTQQEGPSKEQDAKKIGRNPDTDSGKEQSGLRSSLQVKAKVRAEIFAALDDEQVQRPQLPRENALINELIKEYFEYNGYYHALSVLLAESGHPEEPQFDRRFLATELRLREDDRSRSHPLIYALVRGGADAGSGPAHEEHTGPVPQQVDSPKTAGSIGTFQGKDSCTSGQLASLDPETTAGQRRSRGQSGLNGLTQVLSAVRPEVGRILESALGNHEISATDAEVLFRTTGAELPALARVADELRAQTVGGEVTYVRNRNINFTNVCVKRCGFCAFSRTGIDHEGYFLPVDEILRRAGEAHALGATEVCIQAGLPPDMDGSLYPTIARALKSEYPSLHIHAFSPEEVLWGAKRSRCSVEEYLLRLQEAGVGSLPGTSAEILDDALRQQVAKGRLSVSQWVEVISTAHRLGLPTTATMMFGFCETPKQLASHFVLLRDIQKRAQAAGQRGFTEFVPLGFVASEAPIWKASESIRVRPGPTGAEVLRAHAVARLMLNPALPGGVRNLQVSWVKEGFRMAQLMLNAGANDLGGTLMNESISTAAGAQYGQLAKPSELRRLVWELGGRSVAERRTTYDIVQRFESPASDSWECLAEAETRAESREAPAKSLEEVADSADTFGSFHRLIASPNFRFREQRKPTSTALGEAIAPSMPGSGARRFFASPAMRVVTYSPSYTMVPSYECFNACTYCNFRSPVTKEGQDWMSDAAARKKLTAPGLATVEEILVMAGEVHPAAPNRAAWVQRAESICLLALEYGFLPHTNIGPLSREEMQRLAAVNASMGLMLEQAAPLPVHRFAPSKQPSIRLDQLRQASWWASARMPTKGWCRWKSSQASLRSSSTSRR